MARSDTRKAKKNKTKAKIRKSGKNRDFLAKASMMQRIVVDKSITDREDVKKTDIKKEVKKPSEKPEVKEEIKNTVTEPQEKKEVKKEAEKPKGTTIWKPIGGNNPETIGGNSGAYSYTDEKGKTETILIDAGSLFCDENKTGYASILPDIRAYLNPIDEKAPKSKVPAKALFITHGHMDHIGALPHYIKMGFKLPKIYGTPLSLEFVKSVMARERAPKEHWPEMEIIMPKVKDNPRKFENGEVPSEKVKIGNFDMEAVAVSHSMPDSVGYFIKTPSAKIFHSGDMKTDTTIPLSKPFDRERLEELSKDGIDAVMADSTSVLKPGKIPPENDIANELVKIAEENEGHRLIVPIISSSTQRLASIARAAVATDRVIVIEGSSLTNSERCLRKAGFDVRDTVGDNQVMICQAKSKTAEKLPPERTIVVATGTQGESVASFPRAVEGTHPKFKIEKGDVVVMAQTAIPGNEDAHFGVLDKAAAQGAKIIVAKNRKGAKGKQLFEERNIHASGHGAKGDIQGLYKAVTKHDKHTVVVPVHGSEEHMVANIKAAQELGLKTSYNKNFDGLKISHEGVSPVKLTLSDKGMEFTDVKPETALVLKSEFDKNTEILRKAGEKIAKAVEKDAKVDLPKKEEKAEEKAKAPKASGFNAKTELAPEPTKAPEGAKPNWIGARSATGNWLKPYYNYDSIDAKYRKIATFHKDSFKKTWGQKKDETHQKATAKQKDIEKYKKSHRLKGVANKAATMKRLTSKRGR